MKKIYLNTLTLEEIIKRLKDGEVITTPGSNKIKLVDGILVRIFPDNGAFTVGTGMDVVDTVDDNYFLEPEEFKVEKTGKYKTRDGRIAWVSLVKDDAVHGIMENNSLSSFWFKNGRFGYTEDDEENKKDLVEYLGD